MYYLPLRIPLRIISPNLSNVRCFSAISPVVGRPLPPANRRRLVRTSQSSAAQRAPSSFLASALSLNSPVSLDRHVRPTNVRADWAVDQVSPPVGEGRFGVVREAICRETGVLAAVKSLSKLSSQNALKMIRSEVEILEEMEPSMRLLGLYGVYESVLNVHVVTERYGEDLHDYLCDVGWREEGEDRSRTIFTKMLMAVSDCHDQGVVHLDIKPENFLWRNRVLSDRDLDSEDLVLVDFGFASRCEEGQKLEIRPSTGSPSYCAPEVVLDGIGSQRSDSWSLGVVLYALLTGTLPYPQPEDGGFARTTVHHFEEPLGVLFDESHERWEGRSRECLDLARRLMSLAPRDRPSVSEALQHPWIVGDECAEPNTLHHPS